VSGPVNEFLREHVTRVGFDLSLGRSHVAALVWIDFAIKLDRGGSWNEDRRPRRNYSHGLGRAHAHFKTGMNGLQDRGLVVWTDPRTIKLPRGVERWGELPARRIWRITAAGRLVIGLLREAGLYEEYAAALIMPRLHEEAS
jgi:hypothetical protein